MFSLAIWRLNLYVALREIGSGRREAFRAARTACPRTAEERRFFELIVREYRR